MTADSTTEIIIIGFCKCFSLKLAQVYISKSLSLQSPLKVNANVLASTPVFTEQTYWQSSCRLPHMRISAEITVIFTIAKIQLIHLMSRECHETFFPTFCMKSKLQYFKVLSRNCTQQPHTGERECQILNHISPRRSLFFFLLTCGMMPVFKGSISPSLFGTGPQPPHFGQKGALSLEHFQHIEN